MNRRLAFNAVLCLLAARAIPAAAKGPTLVTPLKKSKAEWKGLLTPDRYSVLFEQRQFCL